MKRTAPSEPPVGWPSRIVREAMVNPNSLAAHPLNYRTHPTPQAEALTDVLDRVGWVQRVIVNERTGHILDGHLRVEEARKRGSDVPVVYVDLSEEEERLVLATMDPLAGMAATDEAALGMLFESMGEDLASLAALVHGMGESEDEGAFKPQQSGGEKETEIDPDGFAFAHSCPRCHFEFND